MVNIFRKSNFAYSIVIEAISINASAIWMQDGVYSIQAFNLTNESNIMVIMNNCLMRRHLGVYIENEI